ncbi:ribonuclease T2 family protein [Edaphobacter albus]|uniref:ribonuclease T2 family protein n=1 Tax=Edaphobacter sp. 4G125 TaxID=2763071 RepID=UPI0016474894|nr:ribonuclease T2 [Edaphobacter sp. 4G125]QNI36090.1 ribonuclease T2 [Edaphobacter sp. 4G125]
MPLLYPSPTMKKRFLLLALLPTLSGCNPRPAPVPEPRPFAHSSQAAAQTTAASPQNFDYYLLNLSWSPEYCHSHPSDIQCAQHSTFVLHGLWPQNIDGTYPQNCGNTPGPADPTQYSDIYPDAGLLQHEWKTHGTCSGLAPDTYFATARTAFHSVAIPPTLAQLDHQISLPPDQILSLVTQTNPSLTRQNLALSCGNNYLTAVEVCLDKSLHPIACGPIRSCRANTVRIPPPQ